MKQSVKKIITKVSASLSVVNSTGEKEQYLEPGTIAMHLQSSYPAVFAEYYDVLLWMNENMRQLEGLMDRLI